jgi:4-diphosphocytidyl-2C-methyl-D-erythritol kinase
MIVYPNAKINVGLHITGKRSDGFHTIESCFVPIGLTDILEILPSGNEIKSILLVFPFQVNRWIIYVLLPGKY